MNAILTTDPPVSDDVAALRRAVADAHQRRRNPRNGGPRPLIARTSAPRPSAGRGNGPAPLATRRTHSKTLHSPRPPRTPRGGAAMAGEGVMSPVAGTITPMAMTFWTREEETRLVRELRDGLTIEDIATAHQRTPSAVLARLARMTPTDLDLRTRAQRAEWLREQLLAEPDYDWVASLAATRRRQHDETRANAPRSGKVWTQEEDEQVLAAATSGVSIRDLAAQLQRSTKSTARRIYHLVHRDDAESSTARSDAAAAPTVDTTSVPAQVAPAVSNGVAPAVAPRTSPAPAAGAPAASTSPATQGAVGPSAHGQPWTEEETFKLVEELRQGLPVDDVAAAHQRSVRAINGRAAIVLTHLTGTKHALKEDSTEQLRARLHQRAAAEDHGDRDAIAVLREVLGATPVTG